jgi:hypothetical protein
MEIRKQFYPYLCIGTARFALFFCICLEPSTTEWTHLSEQVGNDTNLQTSIVTCTKKLTSAIQVLFIHKKNRGKHVSSRSVCIIGILKITTTYKWIYMHYIWTSINWLALHSLGNKRFTSHHGKYITNSFQILIILCMLFGLLAPKDF